MSFYTNILLRKLMHIKVEKIKKSFHFEILYAVLTVNIMYSDVPVYYNFKLAWKFWIVKCYQFE